MGAVTGCLRGVSTIRLDASNAWESAVLPEISKAYLDGRLMLLLGAGASITALGQANRYHRHVFLAPPWPEIYETDPERRHGLDVALAEYSRLLETYPSLGYEVLILPKVGVSERADFILNTLEA